MTREEAIKIIKECKEKKFKYTLYTVDEYHAAMEMAINALENENAMIDRVLEIIDRYTATEPTTLSASTHNILIDRMKTEIVALKGEQE